MPRIIPIEKRLAAIIEAISSLDVSAYQQRTVRCALDSGDRDHLAHLLLETLKRNSNIALLAEIEPARHLLPWNKIHAGAARYYAKTLPPDTVRPLASGLELHKREILGPRFHGNAVNTGKRILSFVKGGPGAQSLPRKVAPQTAQLLCYMAEQHPEIKDRIATKVPESVFSEEKSREAYLARVRDDLGLFAVTVAP